LFLSSQKIFPPPPQKKTPQTKNSKIKQTNKNHLSLNNKYHQEQDNKRNVNKKATLKVVPFFVSRILFSLTGLGNLVKHLPALVKPARLYYSQGSHTDIFQLRVGPGYLQQKAGLGRHVSQTVVFPFY